MWFSSVLRSWRPAHPDAFDSHEPHYADDPDAAACQQSVPSVNVRPCDLHAGSEVQSVELVLLHLITLAHSLLERPDVWFPCKFGRRLLARSF